MEHLIDNGIEAGCTSVTTLLFSLKCVEFGRHWLWEKL